jgi:hypothetical protein
MSYHFYNKELKQTEAKSPEMSSNGLKKNKTEKIYVSSDQIWKHTNNSRNNENKQHMSF